MAEERENQQGRSDEADFQGHSQAPLLDDTDPDEAKLKLANDEDDDVEGHANVPSQTP
jgi:hypothetical protein